MMFMPTPYVQPSFASDATSPPVTRITTFSPKRKVTANRMPLYRRSREHATPSTTVYTSCIFPAYCNCQCASRRERKTPQSLPYGNLRIGCNITTCHQNNNFSPKRKVTANRMPLYRRSREHATPSTTVIPHVSSQPTATVMCLKKGKEDPPKLTIWKP
ncbi:hypothetical protein GQ457_15G015080 [Hibiscus cannabinus]